MEQREFKDLLASAENGDVESMIAVARSYEGGLNGVTKDTKLALWWFLQAGNAGNAQAQYELAVWYSDGYHCEFDYQKAVYWCKRAIMQGHQLANELMEVLGSFDI